MKNIFLKIVFLTLLFTFSFCSKETNVAENKESKVELFNNRKAIEKASLEDRIKYADYHMLKIATFIAKESNSSEIVGDILDFGVTNKTNATIYAEDLVKIIKVKYGKNYSDQELSEIQKSLDAFKDLEGSDWKPTISTVMLENKRNRRELDESKPIFILSTDTERENVPIDGYQLNEANNMERLEEEVSLSTVTDNTVLKVAIIKLATDNSNGDGDSGGGGGGGGGVGYNTNGNLNDTNPSPGGSVGTPNYTFGLKIKTMSCLLKKESWIEDNDVYFIGAKDRLDPFLSPNDVPEYFPSITQGWNYNAGQGWNSQPYTDGKLIRHFTGTEVDNQTQILMNWIVDFGQSAQNGTVFYYEIFEADNFPALEKINYYYFPNGDFKVLKYRSYENEYCKPMVFNSFYSSNTSGANPTPFPDVNNFTCSTNNWMIHNLRRE